MSDEILTVAEVVVLVVFGIGEDYQDAAWREVVHLVPEPRPNEQALGGRVEDDALLSSAVEQAQADGASDADAELAEFLVGVEAAADAGSGAVDPVDPTHDER
jgi:hypothetical protein